MKEGGESRGGPGGRQQYYRAKFKFTKGGEENRGSIGKPLIRAGSRSGGQRWGIAGGGPGRTLGCGHPQHHPPRTIRRRGEGATATSLWMGGHGQTRAAPAATLSTGETPAVPAAQLRCSV